VGAIDAHHGSDLPAFVKSLERIRGSNVQWLLPSHGPYFRKDDRLLDAVITRLQRYQHMADFCTCAAEWPLMDQWEQELVAGKRHQATQNRSQDRSSGNRSAVGQNVSCQRESSPSRSAPCCWGRPPVA